MHLVCSLIIDRLNKERDKCHVHGTFSWFRDSLNDGEERSGKKWGRLVKINLKI